MLAAPLLAVLGRLAAFMTKVKVEITCDGANPNGAANPKDAADPET